MVRQALPQKLKGIFVVTWRVLADDGHLTIGEFAFAVGAAGALPQVKASSAPTPWSQVFASWIFFAGLALALGGLASERLIWHGRPELGGTRVRAPLFSGVLIATVAAFAQLVLFAGEQTAGDFTKGLDAGALDSVLSTRPGELTLVVLVALAVAAALASWSKTRPLALLPLLAAVAATSLRGHSGTSGHAWAVAADAAHLGGAALWVGALAHLVLVAARADRPGLRTSLEVGVRRYSRVALPGVLLMIVGGIVTAIAEFRGLDDLISTGYGRTLLIKAGFVAAALALAFAARRRVLLTNPGLRLPLLRRLTGGELGALAGVLLVAAVLVNVAPPRSSATPPQFAQLGPPPLAGPAIRLADLAGQLVVGLAAGERELQFTIVAPGSLPLKAASLEAEAEQADKPSADLFPRPCGPGCFTIRYRPSSGTTTIAADVSASGWQGGRARFEIHWPPAPAQPALLRRVIRTMRTIPSLILSEQVTSGAGSSARPGRYRLTGKYLIANEAYGAGAVDVRPIARRGSLTELAFALPGSSIWYRMTIDRNYRIRRETIISPGHSIRRTFAYPSAAAAATPSSSESTPATPRPPNWPLVLGREDDDLAVGLAARPDGRRVALTATILDGYGWGASGLRVAFRLRAGGSTGSSEAEACGAGCYHAVLPPTGKPQLLTLRLERLGHTPVLLRFPFPQAWPPPSATQLVRAATRVFLHLRSLVIDERIASNSKELVRTVWRFVAPDRAAYRIADGSESVWIGRRRWDRGPGKPWQRSTIDPQSVPTPPWGTPPAKASLLGSGRIAGRPVWLVSFLDPGPPAAWFTLAIDKQTRRTLELRLTAASHFMHHRYSHFNQPLRIVPPERGR